MKLNPNQKRFVTEYLKDLNASKAAIRAGYSENGAKEQGCRLLSNKDIAHAIQVAIDKRAARTEITQDMVVNELRRIAFSGMKSVARWGASGVNMKESEELSDDDSATVQEVNETTNQHGGSLRIKQYDKVKALELLGRHLGMFKDKLIIESDRPLNELSDAELVAKARGNGSQ